MSYVHIPYQRRTKLQPKSQKCVFLGYPDDTKGFKLFNLETNKFIRSRNVVFCEDEFHAFNTNVNRSKWLTIFPAIEGPDQPGSAHNEVATNPENSDEESSSDDENQFDTYEDRYLSEIRNLS